MKFSLVMPAYKSEKTIAESIDTVIAQAYKNWELIIVNDGSQDSTLEIIRDYVKRDERIRVFSQENAGTATANNFGIAQAVGDYITIFPSDDWLLPNYLEEFKRIIELSPGYDIYFANGKVKYEDGRELKIIEENLFNVEPTFIQIVNLCPCSLGAMVKKGVHAGVGWYRKEFYTEDYDFWLRAADKGKKIYFYDEELVKVRISKTQKSANKTAIYTSDLAIMKELLKNQKRSKEEVIALEDRIYRLKLLREGKSDKLKMQDKLKSETGQQLEESSQKFSSLIEKRFGSQNAPKVLNAFHKITFIIRPLRVAFYRLKVACKKER